MSDELILQAADIEQWDAQADVVVIGLGAAGVCASIEAQAAGVSVHVLERASGAGGTTALAAGHLYLGGGTRVQKACGIEDSVEDMYNYIMAVTPNPAECEEKIRLYCEQSVDHFNWLVDQGVPFKDSIYEEKAVVQPTDDCLIWSGNEKVWPYSEKATPAPRGHKVQREGEQGGSLLIEVLVKNLETLGATIEYDCGAKALVVDDTGQVVGVSYKQFGEMKTVKADKGVVLACGGFTQNKEMLAEYAPVMTQGVTPYSNPNDKGIGIQFGQALGAGIAHMGGLLVTSAFYPPASMLKGILINKHGKRFVNEDSYHGRTAALSLEQDDGIVYHIADEATYGKPTMMGQELIDGYETVEEIEVALELPQGSLVETMTNYNKHAENGEDPEMHKYRDWIQPLKSPFAVTQLSLGKSFYMGFTLGGLTVSIDGEVLKEDGRVIDGLYAAGACASNIAQDSNGYSSGTCIGESTFFGRRVGKRVAAEV